MIGGRKGEGVREGGDNLLAQKLTTVAVRARESACVLCVAGLLQKSSLMQHADPFRLH